MTIYLYVKTHNITGLKYLGKTSVKDPHKYPGSGLYWRNHLKVYGYDYTTTILKECQHPAMVTFWGEYYSRLWNVVESDEWANLMPETGKGGPITPEGIKRGLETKRKNGTLNSSSPKSIAKCLATKRKNGTLNTITLESRKKTRDTMIKKYGVLKTEASINKRRDTMIKKYGTLNTNTSTSRSKSRNTLMEKYGTLNPGLLQTQICPHCNKTISKAVYGHYHGDRCNLREE